MIKAVEGGLELAILLPQPLRYLVLHVTQLQVEKTQHTLTVTAIINLKIHLRSCGAHVDQTREPDSRVSLRGLPHVGAGNQTRTLSKNNPCLSASAAL